MGLLEQQLTTQHSLIKSDPRITLRGCFKFTNYIVRLRTILIFRCWSIFDIVLNLSYCLIYLCNIRSIHFSSFQTHYQLRTLYRIIFITTIDSNVFEYVYFENSLTTTERSVYYNDVHDIILLYTNTCS